MLDWFYKNHGPGFSGFMHVWTDFCLPNASVSGPDKPMSEEQE
jgi:hypothetical protein